MKKFVSMLLALAMCLTLVAPVFAVEGSSNTLQTFDVSDSLRIEMRISTQKGATDIQCAQETENKTGKAFELRQIENDNLVQIVSGTVGGEVLTVTNFENGQVTSVETIKVADRVVKTSSDKDMASDSVQPTMGNTTLSMRPGPDYDNFDGDGSLPLAHITYNTSTAVSATRKVDVYALFVKEDQESYTINGKATDTLIVIIGLLSSVLMAYFDITLFGSDIATAIVSELGGNVTGGIIGIAFSENVAVKALYYKMYGRFGRTSSREYDGIAKQVATKSSSHYDEWFFEGYTPYNWKDMDGLASFLWSDFFYEAYPGVRSYS